MDLISKKLRDTKKISKLITKYLHSDSVICLTGDLGAGKTTFTKCLLQYLGVKEVVSSPTFTIIKNYKTKKYDIYHMDLYMHVSSSWMLG